MGASKTGAKAKSAKNRSVSAPKARRASTAVPKRRGAPPAAGATAESEAMKAFATVTEHFTGLPGVTTARMFGSTCLKMSGKVFAVGYKGRLVLKLPPDEVTGLLDRGRAVLFDPGHGRVSKEWVSVAPEPAPAWLALARSARDFVSTGKK
jgi:hypothetical protein